MDTMEIISFDLETNEPLANSVSSESEPQAWELVEKGRYRPRRIKGSCIGRELG